MKYNINLTGLLNTSDEQGTESSITLKQEVLLSEDVELLVEGLQGQIDVINQKMQTMTEVPPDSSEDKTKLDEILESIELLTKTAENLAKKIQVIEEKLALIETPPEEDPGEDPGEDPTDPPEEPPVVVNPGTNSYNVVEYGAVPNDGKSDIAAFTKCFTAAGKNEVTIPSGTFNLPWTTASTFDFNRIMTCKGTGRISIDDFPQPGNRKQGSGSLINPAYEDSFGRFNMSRVNDDVYMSMNMLHEHRSVMNMYHQNYAGVKSRHNVNNEHPKFVPWGQCALRLDRSSEKLPSGNVTFNIGKLGVMIYRNSTKKWEFEPNPYAAGGGFFLKTYDQSTSTLTRVPNKAGGYASFTVPIEKTKDYIVHYWTSGWTPGNITDVLYTIVFCDVWIDSKTPGLEGYFVSNLGLDMKTPNNSHINEFLAGRFYDIGYNKRQIYMHNIMEPYYDGVTGGGANIKKMIAAKSYSVNS